MKNPVEENSFPWYTTVLTGVGLAVSVGAAVAVAPIAIPAIIGGFGAIGVTLGTTAIATTGIIFFGTTIATGTALCAFAGMSIDNHINKEKLKAQSGAETLAKTVAKTGAETLAKTEAQSMAPPNRSSSQPVVMENSASFSEPRPPTIETLKTDEEKIFDLALTTYRMKLVKKICRSAQDSEIPQDIQQDIQQVFLATQNLTLEEKRFILNWFTGDQENINGENFNKEEGPINLGMGDSAKSNALTPKTINETKKKYKFLLEGDLSKKHFLYIEEFCQNIISDGSADFTKKISALKQVSSTALNEEAPIYGIEAYKAHLETTIGSTNLGVLSEEAKAKIKTQSSSFLALDSFEGVSFFSDLTITKPGANPVSPKNTNSGKAPSMQQQT